MTIFQGPFDLNSLYKIALEHTVTLFFLNFIFYFLQNLVSRADFK